MYANFEKKTMKSDLTECIRGFLRLSVDSFKDDSSKKDLNNTSILLFLVARYL